MLIPSIGLGTWKLSGNECEQVVRQGLDLGYRQIDTADGANPQHLKDNLDILDFTLDKNNLQAIHALDCGKRLCAPGGLPVYDD